MPGKHPFGQVLTGIAAIAALVLTSACTGQNGTAAQDARGGRTTIEFWHGWSGPQEVKAVRENVARFEKAHPDIKVRVTGNMSDDKLNQALRAGGDKAPDVVSSSSTGSVGRFCASGVLADLNPFFRKAGLDKEKTIPQSMLRYTQYQGNQCTLPLLSDAYGLYYNKDAFEAAGISEPPKTWSQFAEVAEKLTRMKGDGYEQLGFMPTFHGYETTPMHYAAQWGPVKYFDGAGKSAIAQDPAFAQMYTFQKQLVDRLGGFQRLEKYRSSFGDEWGAEHPFHQGQVAMQLDGEWRLAAARAAGVKFEIGTAALPVPDDQTADYGKGYVSGTVIGLSASSRQQQAAWELVRYMTTDTEAVVSFANAIHNVPSTIEAQNSPSLDPDPAFRTFLDIARHPKSGSVEAQPDGGQYQLTLQDFGYAHEKGDVADLQAGLRRTAEQIDTDIAKTR
ncbi:ABC transporter substrate-binding protein [Streptomyces sp. NBC_00162]|uniref:ABC transporter substrate-binding protein n=1 Tax=Streptomyces sp. NBC_00162 TaxID=2903629 RepID=UPI00214AFC57|nr:ABC transporter substrate-binding protein [Streptomyces sp. NBC_00162]UUU44110.1 ABC transporter substrate-binding protein [Streptomyces sp. NBC_00162]